MPSDVDICVSLDLDEVLEPGWRQEIERVWQPDTTRLWYYFDWGSNIKFKYNKINIKNNIKNNNKYLPQAKKKWRAYKTKCAK